jgi:hypothetical protein
MCFGDAFTLRWYRGGFFAVKPFQFLLVDCKEGFHGLPTAKKATAIPTQRPEVRRNARSPRKLSGFAL